MTHVLIIIGLLVSAICCAVLGYVCGFAAGIEEQRKRVRIRG